MKTENAGGIAMNKNQQALLYRIVAAQLKAAFDAADQLPRCHSFFFNHSHTPRICSHLFGRADLDLIAPRHLWRWKDTSSPDYHDPPYPITYYADAWGVRFEIIEVRIRWSDRDRIARWEEQVEAIIHGPATCKAHDREEATP